MTDCARCGQENPDHARFCLSCGSPLDTAAPGKQAEERKIVSVLFADLVGFTARSERADPEDVRAALRPYHAMLKREIERFGGTVEKFIGDAVMAVFGAPVAREDDAERAVRAALRILDEIPVLNEEHQGIGLAVRVAVNSGEGLVNVAARADHGETLVTGDVVNTAARLQTVAPVGGLVVGEATYRATRDLFDYRSLEAVALKGKADPVPLWQAIAARAGFRKGVDATDATPFVGRDLERTLLQQAYLRTVRERAVQVVTVTGEPGVGKSRLIHEFFRFIDDQPELVWWRHGRCLPYGEGVSFWALGEILKSQAGILESDEPDEVVDKIAEAVALVVEDPSDRDWFAARLGSLVGVAGEVPADRNELFAAWRGFLEAMASARPLVAVFEDLHWADDSMLDFIEYLVDWSSDVPILVLCTARPELYERHAGWGGGKRNATTVGLNPLTPEESHELISALLGGEELDAGVRQTLLDRSGGNPLYAEEFIRMVKERTQGNGNGSPQVAVPDTVHALIAARLDTLPQERKAILHDASVVGRVFWAGAVAHIAGVGSSDVQTGLHDLSRKELVRPVRKSSVKNEAEFSFWHALVRDVAYGQIPRAPRSRKHRAAAEWIESLAGERVADHAEVLVYHYREAASLARAAGLEAEAAELDRKLLTNLVLAGSRTLQLDARRSQVYLSEALELCPSDAPERPAILARLAESAHDWGDLDTAERVGRQAADALSRQDDALLEARNLINLDDTLWLRGMNDFSLLGRALSILERLPPSEELALVKGTIGFRHVHHGDLDTGMGLLDEAVHIADSLGGKTVLGRLLYKRGPTRVEMGDLGGLDDLRDGLRLNMDAGLTRPTQVAYNNLADVLFLNGEPSAALDVYRKGIEFADRRGLLQPRDWSSSEMTRVLYEVGLWDELLAVADALLDPTSMLQLNRSQGVLFAAMSRARVLARRGTLGDDLIASFLPRAREVGDLQVVVPALVAGSEIEMLRGRRTEAVDTVEEFQALTEGRPAWRALGLCDAVRVQVWAQRHERAGELLEGMRSVTPRDQCGIAGARAVLAEAASTLDEAADLHRAAAGHWRRFGNVVEEGLAFLGESRCRVAIGDRTGATDPLRRAHQIFGELGAASLVADAEALTE